MHDLPSNGHFKRDYAIGIPEGYIRGGTARPYSEMWRIEIAAIQFYFDLSHSHRQMQWCNDIQIIEKHSTAAHSLENHAYIA